MRGDKERLEDILEAVGRIEKYAARGKKAFLADELIQTWVVYHLQIMGEAVARLSSPFQQAHPEIPWRQMAAMRNILVHEYFGIDVAEVWSAVERDLPGLKKKIQSVLDEAAPSE